LANNAVLGVFFNSVLGVTRILCELSGISEAIQSSKMAGTSSITPTKKGFFMMFSDVASASSINGEAKALISTGKDAIVL